LQQNEIAVEEVTSDKRRLSCHYGYTSPGREGGIMVQVGQKAPDFSLKTNKMQDFKLSDLQGKKNVVLLFVPLAFTGG
jgi:AhpC/TSA family